MNDEQARARFENLTLPLMKDAYNLARWLMRNEEDAQDVVQDSYVKAFRFFESFRTEGNVRAWFLRIVRNTCYDALKTRNVKERELVPEGEINDIPDAAPGPRASVVAKATIETVREAIAALPADFREIVVLRELEGLSYKEISEVAGIPLGTVMSRLSRARDQLQLSLRERKEHDDL
ncbi:MAG: sigma-70 family RNA polymerase sigma factor [Verrucomicrobia bacterium]|nr:sigma-70 family RNA polymerase sigma factor [Verrucomicrobiota bacterium]